MSKADDELIKNNKETFTTLDYEDLVELKELYNGYKEEIEKSKKECREIIGNFKSATTELTKDIFPKKANAIEILLEYINQLETSKQKLIDKLEEDSKRKIPLAEDMDYAMGRRDEAIDIFKIVKGEN